MQTPRPQLGVFYGRGPAPRWPLHLTLFPWKVCRVWVQAAFLQILLPRRHLVSCLLSVRSPD